MSVHQGTGGKQDGIHHRFFSYSEPNQFDLGLVRSGEAVRTRFSHPSLRISMVVPTFARRTKMAQEILDKSPLAIRLLKSAFNADVDGQAGLQELAGNATLLFYMTEEAKEAKNAFLEKRKADFRQFPWLPW